MKATEELKEAWKEIKDNIQQRHCYPSANADRHPSPRSVFLVDQFISNLADLGYDYTKLEGRIEAALGGKEE